MRTTAIERPGTEKPFGRGLAVRDLMTAGVFAVQPDDDLATVSDLMEERNLRHMPVVDPAGLLVGLVTQRDLLRHASKDQARGPQNVGRSLLLTTPVREVMTREVLTARPDQDIREAARVLLQRKLGCLPVVEGDRLVGILTEADFVRLLSAGD